MSIVLIQGQTENPIAIQWGTSTLATGHNETTFTLASSPGWANFADNNWAGVMNLRTTGTTGFIDSVGATTMKLVHSTNNTSVVDLIGIGRLG